jgi:hypothetical protein
MSEPSAVVTRLPVPNAVAAERAAAAVPVMMRPSVQQRATLAVAGTQRAFTRLIPQLQYQLLRVGPAGLTGLAALIVAAIAAVVVWLPAHNAGVALRTELLHSAVHGQGSSAPAGINHLVAALPTRAQIPAVLGQMLVEADKAGVALDHGHYDFRPPQSSALGRYAFEFPVRGSYPNVRDFIDRTLTEVPAAGLEKLRIERKSVGDTLINADIGFVVYVRGE